MRIRDLEIFLTLDPGSGMGKIRIRDPTWTSQIRNCNTGSCGPKGAGKAGKCSLLYALVYLFFIDRSGGDGRRNSEIRQSIPVPGLGEICEEEEEDLHLDQEVFRWN